MFIKVIVMRHYRRDIYDSNIDMLDISGDVLDLLKRRHDITADEYTLLDLLLGLRSWALNNLFENHCTDEEVRRFAAVNEQLYNMTQRMYERTRMVNDFIKTMPLHEKDDGVTSVLELEDDGTTWAEAWLCHPELDHLVICHAVHRHSA